MEIWEIVSLVCFLLVCFGLFVYEFLCERKRHKAFLAKEQAQMELYRQMLVYFREHD